MSPEAVTLPARPLSPNEVIKAESHLLRGTIAQDLDNTETGAISEANGQLTKFHGLYLQDDRDLRNALKKAGQEKAFAFMLRVRLPGGRATAAQWRVLDRLADEVASPSLRLTTRQTIQFHGILKGNVRRLIQGMHQVLLDSIAACGDVNRNVMAPPNPEQNAWAQQVYDQARAWSEFALPKTHAYHEIYLGDDLVAGGEPKAAEEEPLYGATYLPRKFKVGFALPPSNDVDIFSQDLGFTAIIEGEKLVGYNVTVGGGLGMSHGNDATFPRLADVLGFVPVDQVNRVGTAVLTTQRDFGDRANRKHARLKYTIEDRGIDWFKGEVETRLGAKFQPARAVSFTTIEDPLGWQECADGSWFYGLHILSGRIKNSPGWPMKQALREIAEIHRGEFRLTPSQNLTLSGVAAAEKPQIEEILTRHGLAQENQRSRLRRNALSCVALPTCGLALAESERILPDLLARLEPIFAAAGLADEPVSLRVTGCPNGCARPYLAEIGLVGRAPNKYALYLGARYQGTRLNRLFAASVTLEGAVEMLTPIIQRFAVERQPGESFGDFCDRVILPADATFHHVGTPPLEVAVPAPS